MMAGAAECASGCLRRPCDPIWRGEGRPLLSRRNVSFVKLP
ncbi:type I secretion protein TolC [Burkholderia thailandensis]|nr:type I secretion protein TolC [Burkholderia thailandensis]